MKGIAVSILFLMLFACSSLKEKEPSIISFQCDMSIPEFSEKVYSVAGLGGFYVAESDSADNNLIFVLQKMISRKGAGESLVVTSDQIRFRYSLLDSTVIVSYGVLTESNGKKKFNAAKDNDKQRHLESVNLTIDRIFMRCNPGKPLPERD